MILGLTLLTQQNQFFLEINVIFKQSEVRFFSLTAQLLCNLILCCTLCSEIGTKLFIVIETTTVFL